MQLDSIEFDFTNQILRVVVGEVVTEYTTRAAYLAAYPDRVDDCDSIGWPQ